MRQPHCGVAAGVGFEAVGKVAAPETLPNVTEGESFALVELIGVSQLVKKQTGFEGRDRGEVHGVAECDGSDRTLAEEPSAYPRWNASSTEPDP